MDSEQTFHVRGSNADPYIVVFRRVGARFSATCTCAAGEHGTMCKHRSALIAGDVTAVISGDLDAVPLLPSMISGTKAEAILKKIAEIESAISGMKREVKQWGHALMREINS